MQPDQDKYEFIMSPAKTKKGLIPTNVKLGKRQLILFGAFGVALLGMIILVVVALLGSGPSNKDRLIRIAAQQNELIRVSDLALKEARGTEARNLATTARLSLESDKASLTAALKAQKIKINNKQLQSAKSTDTDKKLNQASQNNRFDEVFLEYIRQALAEYQQSLSAAYKTTANSKLKAAMKTQYQNASTLIGAEITE